MRHRKAPHLEHIQVERPADCPGEEWQALSGREKIFVAGLSKGMSQADAARLAGYKDGPGLYVTASRKLRKANVSNAMEEVFAEQGVTLQDAIKVIGQAMQANQAMVLPEKIYDPKTGRLKKFIQKVVDDLPDHNTRLAGAKVYGRWTGKEALQILPPNKGIVKFEIRDGGVGKALKGFRSKVNV